MLEIIAVLVVIAFIVAVCHKPSDPNLMPHKGGHNDLGKWEAFGGSLKRPDPPKLMCR